MRLDFSVKVNLRDKEVKGLVKKAAQEAMRDTVVATHGDSVKLSPVKTGNNRRSLAFEASGFGSGEGIVDQDRVQGAVYSTSGYGGYLETGTRKMAAQPYMKPALDMHIGEYPEHLKERLSGAS